MSIVVQRRLVDTAALRLADFVRLYGRDELRYLTQTGWVVDFSIVKVRVQVVWIIENMFCEYYRAFWGF